MAFIDYFRRLNPFRPSEQVNKAANVEQPSQETGTLPVLGGRSSVSDSQTMFTGINGKIQVKPLFPKEFIMTLEGLSIHHPDISHAVANIVELGCTEHNITFEDTVSNTVARKARAHIESIKKTIYNSEGVKGLITDLLRQAAVSGAVSAEIVPRLDLKGVDSVVLVAPWQIEFLYNSETKKNEVYQRPVGLASYSDGETDFVGLIRLNPITFKFLVTQRINDNPYPIPPFIAALENTGIGKHLLSAIKHIAENLGILGVMTFLSEAPLPLPGELPTSLSYQDRCIAYLSTWRGEIEKGMKNGIVVGFKKAHEIDVHPTHTDAKGAKEIFDINDQQLMSALKQEPSLLGRDMKTSEAFAKIAFKILASRIGSFQDVVAIFLSELYRIELQLRGFPIKTVNVQFEKVDVADKLLDEQAETARINNVKSKYDFGIINMQQAANELGYEKPDQLVPRTAAPSPNTEGDKTAEKKKLSHNCLHDPLNRFDYESEDIANATREESLSFEGDDLFDDEEMQSLYDEYVKKVKKAYKASITEALSAFETSLLAIGVALGVDELIDKVLYHLADSFQSSYSERLKNIVPKYIDKGYKKFRLDSSIFGTKAVGEAVLEMPDFRALAYFKTSDELYLGKFITDADTRQRLTDFIKETYLRDGEAISHNPQAIARFRASLKTQLLAEDWKVNRVIATTVNKMRNYAAVNYMAQAEVKWFEIRGVNDRKQCDYCKNMQGRRFLVTDVAAKIDKIVGDSPEFVADDSPFVTSVFKTPNDMKGLTDSEMFDRGIHAPPFHPNCRDLVVPIIE